MKTALCTEYGAPSGLSVVDVDDLVPGSGEVLVDVHAAAVNFPDVLVVANRYQLSAPVPFTPGSEFAGVVAALGPGVTGPPVGSPVAGAVFTGAFAEQVVVPVSSLRPIPDGLDMVHGAAFHVTYATAYHALVTVGNAAPGEWVAVLGAAGGVGSAAVDIATRLGLHVIAAASSAERLTAAEKLGAVGGVDYLQEDLKTRLRELSGGEGVHLVIDPVGGRFSEAAFRGLRRQGRFVTVGYADGEIPSIPLNLVLLKDAVIRGFEIRVLRQQARETVAAGDQALAELVRQGMRPMVSSVHPLSDVAAALTSVAERRTTGKVVLTMRD
ncbi:NADPH:quinone oxidoreductase family protein [Nocardia sp. XZ_19_231]|uniref:NADPH:quinone oxidoreductase family protein n=1 Tax=Nocardia sp. XZ_19_231 TaxID=2769252 RepID=UPI00188FA011|nr:NADPH:quinone oxidoreductase family protein [Nocardia sp. XZ_19_231]